MRLFLWLIAAFVVTPCVNAATLFPLFKGLPDGAVLTISFFHNGRGENPEEVGIDFIDGDNFEYYKNCDIPAHIRLERNFKYPVVSNTLKDGHWMKETWPEQILDDTPPSKGFWRVDVVKLDTYRLNVFFQGFWSDVRTFHLSLNNIRSVVIKSEFIDHSSLKVTMKNVNNKLVPPTYDQFKNMLYEKTDYPREISTLPGFPIGAHLEMVVMLRTFDASKYRSPAVVIASDYMRSINLVKISQVWGEDTGIFKKTRSTNKLFIATPAYTKWRPFPEESSKVQCTDWWSHPNGDLVHLRLERIGFTVFELKILYKSIHRQFSWTQEHITCRIEIEKEYVMPNVIEPDEYQHFNITKEWKMRNFKRLKPLLDRGLDVKTDDGAVILHMEHSIPANYIYKWTNATGDKSYIPAWTSCTSYSSDKWHEKCSHFEGQEENCHRLTDCDGYGLFYDDE